VGKRREMGRHLSSYTQQSPPNFCSAPPPHEKPRSAKQFNDGVQMSIHTVAAKLAGPEGPENLSRELRQNANCLTHVSRLAMAELLSGKRGSRV
jgi:hypothetical protein